MSVTAETDTSRFEDYIRKLSRAISPTNPEGVLQQFVKIEAAAVLKTTASWVKPAKLGKLKAQRAFNVLRRIEGGTGVVSVNSGRRGGVLGRVWFGSETHERKDGKVGRGGKTWFIAGTYHPLYGITRAARRLPSEPNSAVNRLWQGERNDAREEVNAAVARRGLAMRGWIDAIEDLGLDVDSVPPQSARIPPNARNPRRPMGISRFSATQQVATPGQFLLIIVNRSGLAVRTGGKNLVERAIRRRAGAFRNALKNGVFESAESLARFYPGIRVE